MHEAYASSVHLLRLFSISDRMNSFRTWNVSLHGKWKLVSLEKTYMLISQNWTEKGVNHVAHVCLPCSGKKFKGPEFLDSITTILMTCLMLISHLQSSKACLAIRGVMQ